MKTSSTVLFLMAAAVVTAPLLRADVVNRVTLSGTISTVGTPVTRTSASGTTSITKLVNVKITNATILDAMVSTGALASKTGYGLVEILNDDGTSQGFFARNTRTGDNVAVTSSLLSGFSGQNLITAESSATHAGADGSVTEITGSSFTGSADSIISGTPASVFILGQTAGRNFTNRVSGQVVKVPYVSTTYTALIRGVSSNQEVINAKLVSTGSTYVLNNN